MTYTIKVGRNNFEYFYYLLRYCFSHSRSLRKRSGEGEAHKKLSQETVVEIYQAGLSGMTVAERAVYFNVPYQTVQKIDLGKACMLFTGS